MSDGSASPRRRPMVRNTDCDVFVSYAPADGTQYADALASAVRNLGYATSANTQFPPAVGWAAQVETPLRNARALILVLTPAAVRSERLTAELDAFVRFNSGAPVLPIVFDPPALEGLATGPLAWIRDILWLKDAPGALRSGPSRHTIEELEQVLRRRLGAPSPVRRKPPDIAERERQALNEAKLILVGRGAVGKTSLVNRLLHETFHGDEGKTEGISITQWPIVCGPAVVRLHVWDFGGQEIMHATHQFFLTERSLYLLVLNGREGGEDDDTEYWLRHIQAFGGDSPILVVQNKISQHPFELNYRGLRARYPQIRAFVQTDCRDGIGIDELRRRVQEAVLEMPEVQMWIPVPWFRVKDRLERLGRDFMSYESFRDLCRDEGIVDWDDQRLLSWMLHCLGIALNYRDDPRLRETSVLKPEWVTRGIYKLLNARPVAERQGELHLADLQTLLPEGAYPAEKHAFLLELMRKFSLCFAFPDNVDRYLVPELLSKEEPEAVNGFPMSDSLSFEYQYGVLPEGLIPRFIVRSHPLSRGQARWRSGVILSYEECLALVKSIPGDRRVIVRVRGPSAEARRQLLGIIRYDIDRIHAEFKDRLEVRSTVPLRDHPEVRIEYQKLITLERNGIDTYPEAAGRDILMVRVGDLLNGVDLNTQRADPLAAIERAKTVFFSYSHRDETLRDELETHLKLLQRQGVLSAWHDRKLPAGAEWAAEIDDYLERADIILLLVSADFLASDYCWDRELRRAMQRHDASEAVVVPIILRASDWQTAPFGRLQALPTDGRPVVSWSDRDAAWTDVAKGIRKLAKE
jgi:internalin A